MAGVVEPRDYVYIQQTYDLKKNANTQRTLVGNVGRDHRTRIEAATHNLASCGSFTRVHGAGKQNVAQLAASIRVEPGVTLRVRKSNERLHLIRVLDLFGGQRTVMAPRRQNNHPGSKLFRL